MKDSLIKIIIFNICLILILLLFMGCKKTIEESTGIEDSTPPVTAIVNYPQKLTNSQDALFELRCSESSCRFMCALDSEVYEKCNETVSYSGLNDGEHTFNAYAIDGSGNVESLPVSYKWIIDTTPPVASIKRAPLPSTTQNFAVFELSCSEVECTFECGLDSGGFMPCESPVTFASLAKGAHQFRAIARDRAGNTQSDPTIYEWNIIATILSVYPFDGDKGVPLGSMIFLSFSDPVDENTLMNGFYLTDGSSSVAGNLEISQDKMFARFIPSMPLDPGKTYQVIINGLATSDGAPFILPYANIVSIFTTASEKITAGDGLHVTAVEPDFQQVYDFSTIRIYFSEPIKRESVVYGTTFKITKISDSSLVSGRVIVKENKLIFDPDSDLAPGEEYQLDLTSGITAKNGEQLTSFSTNFIPIGTSVLMTLSNKMEPDIDDVGGDPAALPVSNMTGENINSSTIYSKLLGISKTYLKSILNTEVRVAEGENILHLVMRKGQRIMATGMDIKLAGYIDTLLDTGDITMYLITDADGIITTNPNADINNSANPSVYLKVDTCITAQDNVVNSVLNQDLVDLRLYGEMVVYGNRIAINAMAITELNLMSIEKAPVTLTMRLMSTSLSPPADVTPPELSSIYPAQGEDNVARSEPIIVTFSEPVDPQSLNGRLTLQIGSSPVPVTYYLDGSSVIIRPTSQLLNPNTQYTIQIFPGVRDLNGNSMSENLFSIFTTVVQNGSSPQATLISTIYPGVPCILKNGSSSSSGKCSINDSGNGFPIFELPVNRNIVAYFTKPIRPTSINENSFQVIDTTTSQPIIGSRIVEYNKVTFIPNDPFVIGRSYQLHLVGGTNTVCDTNEICGIDNMPLNTNILDDAENSSTEIPGGPDMIIPFVVTSYTEDLLLPLTLKRYTDTNSNGLVDGNVPSETQYNENSVYMVATAMGIPIPLRTFLSGTLLINIKPFDPAVGEIPLEVLPGGWIFGTSVTALVITSNRLLVRPTGSASGRIKSPSPSDPNQHPITELELQVWMDAVNTAYGSDCDGMNIQDTPVIMNLSGRVSFTDNGRMVTALSNSNIINSTAQARATIIICVPLPTDITISAGDAVQRAVTMPAKR